jgi:response regulator RpfG family c-di-GMP phosphodiesterase
MEEKKAVILLVDDEANNLFTMAKYLEESPKSYDLITAIDAGKAFEIAQSTPPDLIITDWEMPVISGIELLKMLKRSPNTQNIPVLIVSGIHTYSENLQLAMEAGAIDYIRKPIEKIELWARVNSVLKLMESYNTIIRQKNEIERKNILLEEQKNRELSSKVLEIYKKNQTLQDIQKQVEETIPLLEGKNKSSLKNIVRSIKMAINDKHNWENFRLYFEKVHPSFFTVLKQNFSNLTTEDIKYCAYMRIQMSNREIAHLLNINQESVRTHKYRIKKKMALAREVDLQQYIDTIEITSTAKSTSV